MTAFKQHLDDVDSLFANGTGKYNTAEEKKFIEETYTVCRNISIDYGIMEKADNVFVLPVDFGWSDLGTWGSLHSMRDKDEKANSVLGSNVLLYDTENCIIHMPDDKLVVVQGLNSYIVVEDNNTLLVCRKEDEQKIRQFVHDVRLEKGEKFV